MPYRTGELRATDIVSGLFGFSSHPSRRLIHDSLHTGGLTAVMSDRTPVSLGVCDVTPYDSRKDNRPPYGLVAAKGLNSAGSWETMLTPPASPHLPVFALSQGSIASLHHHQFNKLSTTPCQLLPTGPIEFTQDLLLQYPGQAALTLTETCLCGRPQFGCAPHVPALQVIPQQSSRCPS